MLITIDQSAQLNIYETAGTACTLLDEMSRQLAMIQNTYARNLAYMNICEDALLSFRDVAIEDIVGNRKFHMVRLNYHCYSVTVR